MNGTRTCGRCGAALTAYAPEGLCPHCILRGVMAAAGGAEGSDEEFHFTPASSPGAASSAERSSAGEPSEARRFGDYELLGELGRGGMGVVYKARQRSLHRVVALKMIQSQRLASAAMVQRFHLEAEAAASLRHPNIVAIHEVGEHAGQHFFSMDFIEGRSLAGVIQDLRFTIDDLRRAARWVKTIAEAIHHAHQHGILHRDLKPSNILIDATGEPHVTDFGLAQRIAGESTLTVSGEAVGSPAYMAPEQAGGSGGSPRSITIAADVYGLGGILYELLTGRTPFGGANPAETLHRVLHADPAAPRALNPATPRDLETICLKCLEKEPARRYGSAQHVAEELGRFLRDEPIEARPAGVTEKVGRWARRNPMVAGLSFTSLVLLLGVAVIASVSAFRLRQSEQLATRRLHGALLAQAQAGHWSARPGRRFDSLEAIAQAAKLAPRLKLAESEILQLRNEAIACLAMADLRLVGAWPRLDHVRNDFVSLDEATATYASSTTQGIWSVRRLTDDHELEQLDLRGAPFKWDVSRANGHWLAVKYNSGQFRLWNLTNREVELELKTRRTEAVAFSPDGRLLAVDQPGRSVLVRELESGRHRLLPASTLHPNWLQFSGSGRKLAVSCTHTPVLQVWDLAGGTATNLAHPAYTLQMAWRSDDRLLAVACADHRIYLWDTASWKRQAVLEGHQAVAHRVAFHPSGPLLASWGWDGVTRVWDPASAAQMLAVPGPEFIRFSRDGRHLAFKSGLQLGLWEVALGEESRRLKHSAAAKKSDDYVSASFSADGLWLAAAGSAGVTVWDGASLVERAFLPVGDADFVTFHPRNRDLISCSRRGLQLWPARALTNAADAEAPRFIELPNGATPRRAIFDGAGGKLLVEVREPRRGRMGLLLDAATLQPIRTLERRAFHDLTLSSDGRWAAAGNWHGSGVSVWNLEDGQTLRELPAAGSAVAQFSPDHRWLVTTTGEEYQFWNTGSWERAHRLQRNDGGDFPGVLAFTADGQVIATAHSRYLVKLVQAATGRELATLDTPGIEEVGALGFSPDGSRLAVASGTGGVRVWDLRRIRAHLAKMGLDW